jgi:hypothetical protein
MVFKSLEKFKVDLQLGAFEHQTRFTKLHEQRAKIVAELYARLVKMQRSFVSMLNPLPVRSTDDSIMVRIKVAQESANEFLEYFDENQIFLDSEICSKLIQLGQEFREIYLKFITVQLTSQDTASIDALNAWSNGIDRLNKEIPQLKEEIESRFREMLGDRSKVSSNLSIKGKHV